ncbi:glycosyltransferase family 2 protein [Candidatus Peregrinibacteria bacterium]|nr:glycosyltransferase family 2 protein [Candidatus Peregrinibacteria bacterium]
MEQPYLTIVIPAYNEDKNLECAVSLIKQKIKPLLSSYEILIVDDGSSDNTGMIADKLSSGDKEIRVIHHHKNLGPGSGLFTGINNAYGEFIIFIPADIAIDLDQFNKYLEASKEADIVVGLRNDRKDYSIFRKINSVIYIWMIKLLFNMRQRQFNYVHLYRKSIFDRIKIESKSVFITAEILIKARDLGYRLTEVEINYVPRKFGEGSCSKPIVIYNTFKDMIVFWFQWIFRKSIAPQKMEV